MLPGFSKEKTPKMPTRYGINLMWVNQTLDPNQPYLSKNKTEEEAIANFLDKAKKWKVANPEAEVNIWYDSQFATKEAIAATQRLLDTKVQPELSSKIRLRDVREIDIVKNNPDVFSDMIPIYFRVDLLKLIIIIQNIEQDANDVAIFSDLEVGDRRPNQDRMGKNELFKEEVMNQLSIMGITLGIDGWGKVENQFIQVLNMPQTLTALKITIDANMFRVISMCNLAKEKGLKGLLAELTSACFASLKRETPALIYGLKAQTEKDKIKVNAKLLNINATEEWIDYDPYVHGCLPLGNFFKAAYVVPLIIEKDGSLTYQHKYIKLPQVPLKGRDDMDTRTGMDHSVNVDALPDRNPTQGEKYQCHFMITPMEDLKRKSILNK